MICKYIGMLALPLKSVVVKIVVAFDQNFLFTENVLITKNGRCRTIGACQKELL